MSDINTEVLEMQSVAELLLSIDDALEYIKTLPRRRPVKILVVPDATVDEIAAMNADADALESGERVAAFRLTDEQLEEIHADPIGEFETYSPWR